MKFQKKSSADGFNW